MQSLDSLKARIDGARALSSIVGTMKILAAVGSRQVERARAALDDYGRGVELALQIALRGLGKGAASTLPRRGDPLEAIVLGSDLGMCGQFNDRIAAFAAEGLGRRSVEGGRLIVVGERAAARLEDLGLRVDALLPCPSSPGQGAAWTLREILSRLDSFSDESPRGSVAVFHNRHSARGGESQCLRVQLLPVDPDYLEAIGSRPWRSRSLPLFRMDGLALLHASLRETIHISLYRSLLDSMESENAARLEAMETAERNIEERLAELGGLFNEARQEAITAELLDIVSASEALSARAHPDPSQPGGRGPG